jgi:hypothetical protein
MWTTHNSTVIGLDVAVSVRVIGISVLNV